MTTPDISAVLVARDEGVRNGISLHSALDAAAAARATGLEVEVLVLLAGASAGTREALSEAADHGARVETIGAAGPGAVRNYAVAAATGTYVALLEGGALWSENWLAEAHRVAATDDRAVVHPEVHWFYEHGRELYFPPDQDDPAFDPAVLRLASCWDGAVLTAAAVHRAVPFPEVGDAPGELDWAWSRATLDAGYRHRIAPRTISFRRRRPATLR